MRSNQQGLRNSNTQKLAKQKMELIESINRERQNLKKMDYKLLQSEHKIQKVVQSNQKHSKRLLRHQARLEELKKFKDKPQHLLAYTGAMNQYVQAFMMSHNFEMNVDPSSINPDHMSYEQLIELGQKIGKVSKGLPKEQIDKLTHSKVTKKGEECPICCTEYEKGEMTIILRCKHSYHQQCILQWLKDQNKCPMCKTYILEQEQEIEDN